MKVISLAVSVLFLSSCAITYKMPSNRFETPEALGDHNKSATVGVGQGKSVEITPDFTHVWGDDSSGHSLNNENFYTVGGNIGISSKVDVGVKYVSDLGIVGTGKWQFIGDGRGEHGFKAAIMGNVGAGSETKEESSPTSAKAELTNYTSGLDLILGYRTGKEFLFYLSAFYDYASFDLKQRITTTEKMIKGNSRNAGGTLGLDYSFADKGDIVLEYAHSRTTYGPLLKDDRDAFGGKLIIFF